MSKQKLYFGETPDNLARAISTLVVLGLLLLGIGTGVYCFFAAIFGAMPGQGVGIE